jgi:general stress protein YciG
MPTNTRDENLRKNDNQKNEGKGKQGFASMPKDQVREIAAEGGRHSHDHDNTSKNKKSSS